MKRREAIRNMAILFGTAISVTTVGVIVYNNSINSEINQALFTATQESVLEELADLIIPDTDVPGAKAAAVGPFICMMIKECYPESIQEDVVAGLVAFEDKVKDRFGKGFLDIPAKDRATLIGELRSETIEQQHASNSKETEGNAKAYMFEIVRDLTILGYFTSEVGTTQACAYLPVPGHYNGSADLKPGQRRWHM